MAPADTLSPAGSATYDSNTMYVGDGTWDSTRNDFLLPNIMGLNFDTMRYNGMGNRFKDMPGYYSLVLAHGILAAMTFLFVVPAAIMIARFYGRNPRWALRFHIYLQVLTIGLTTVLFVLGWFAVGSRRSLTNPHHGIGVAIYVLVLVQAIGGAWIHRREKGKIVRKLPVKLVLHQWFGRTIALLGIAQVPIGLTLYGAPLYLFVLYAVWMAILFLWYFVLSYRARAPMGGFIQDSHHGESVISERRPSRIGAIAAPVAAGAGFAALLGRNRNRSRSRDRVQEVIPSRRGSRRGSSSFIEKHEYEEKKSGGIMDKLFKGAAVLGAGALAKSWFDRKKMTKEEDDYSSVSGDTPSRVRNPRRHNESEFSEDTQSLHRMEEARPSRSNIALDPTTVGTAITTDTRPVTPRPIGGRRDSYDSLDYSSTMSPSQRPRSEHGVRNGVMAGLGLGWFAKKMKDRRDAKQQRRREQDELRVHQERLARKGNKGSRFTGDGFTRHNQRVSQAESSDLSTILTNPHQAGSSIPAVPVPLGPGGSTTIQSHSRHNVTEPVEMPIAPPDPHGVLHQDSEIESEAYISGGGTHRRRSSRRRAEGEAAAAAAAASGLAAAEKEKRRRERSQAQDLSAVSSPPVSVKVKVHGDKDRNVTLRRLTQEEAAAERAARRGQRRRRAESVSSISGTDTVASRRKYRRDASQVRNDELRAEKEAEALAEAGPPVMAPLSPPDPPYAGGRKPKDSAYYSGTRPLQSVTSVVTPDSHGTWSEMSPSGVGAGSGQEDPAERRRRRRLERNQRQAAGTVDFT
ncbi:hypothetical protein PVAG01_04509 [Phlyctema vagabunda]|uniref:Cytochrome b561 domain-containing protein n=1 Tax=Phlyctema vagabunda TaxID=108571 RepID=A0ABR4PPV2_9HELO